MAMLRRPRLRDRNCTVSVSLPDDSECCRVWLPPVDERQTVPSFAEAAALAVGMLDAPVERDALVLLDDAMTVAAIVFDSCDIIGLDPSLLVAAGLVDEITRSFLIVPQSEIDLRPTVDEVHALHALRRFHVLRGIELIDVLTVDCDNVKSVAIAIDDPDCFWFTEPDGSSGVDVDCDVDTRVSSGTAEVFEESADAAA